MEWKKDEFLISTDKERLSLEAIHGFLLSAYWSKGRPRDVVAASIENSLNFGVYHGDKQVGFARVVSDYATMFWLCDVFILEDYRGRGLAKWLMECVTTHPDLCGLLGILATRDAHRLYEQYGFKVPNDPRRFMRKERK